MTTVAASGFTFVSWWQSYCCSWSGRPAGRDLQAPYIPCIKCHIAFPLFRMYQRISRATRHIYPFRNKASCYSEGFLGLRPNPCWRTIHFRLSAIAYLIYSQLPTILEAVPTSATWGRAMPWWLGPTNYTSGTYMYTVIRVTLFWAPYHRHGFGMWRTSSTRYHKTEYHVPPLVLFSYTH